jgi:hypothetical protein
MGHEHKWMWMCAMCRKSLFVTLLGLVLWAQTFGRVKAVDTFGIGASEDTFVRGGTYRRQPYGNADELTIKSHHKPVMERISLLKFEGVVIDPSSKMLEMMLTVSSSAYQMKKALWGDQIALCTVSRGWKEHVITYASYSALDTPRKHCIFGTVPRHKPGDSICLSVPTHFVQDGTVSVEIILVARSHLSLKLVHSSDNWLSFASRESTRFLGPRLFSSKGQCKVLKGKPINFVEKDCSDKTVGDKHALVPVHHNKDEKSTCFYEYDSLSFFKSAAVDGQIAKRALIYSPYDLSFGGGEKYLLEVVAFFIRAGYQVALITHDNNYCLNKGCVLATAEALRVDLPTDFAYMPLTIEGLRRAHEDTSGIDIYYAMGNGRFPEFRSPGRIGIYQCQFPFDLAGPYSASKLQTLSTMQVVIVNSQFTSSWYTKFLVLPLQEMEKLGLPYPTVEIVYPPVSDPNETGTSLHPLDMDTNVYRIAMIGRVFTGRQNKGHLAGIQALIALNKIAVQDGGPSYELHIVGNVQPGFEDYAERLRALAYNEMVFFHLGVSADELKAWLGSCHTIWHLTGIDQDLARPDPASFEHFGISVVEGILLGLHPIVMNAGGLTEAVGAHGDKVNSLRELITATEGAAMKHAASSADERIATALAAKKHATTFLVKNFQRRLDRIIVRSKRSNKFQRKYLPLLPYSCAKHTDLAKKNVAYKGTAFIYVHSMFWHAKMTTRNVMGFLGPRWQLCIAYPRYLHTYASMLAAGVMGKHFNDIVKLMPLDIDTSSTDGYSNLLMTKKFWQDLEHEHVFIFQTDAALVRDPVSFLKEKDAIVPFLGAPWCTTNEIFESKAVDTVIGNGGLSYRSNSFMQRCLASEEVGREIAKRRIQMQGNGQAHFMMNEDLFFSVCMTTLYSRAEVEKVEEIGKTFAVEVPCEDTSVRTAAGLHATWYYVSESSIAEVVNATRTEVGRTRTDILSCR